MKGSSMPGMFRSRRFYGWATLVLLAAAVLAVAVPVTLYALAVTDHGHDVGDSPVEVHASAGRTWGLYFNDADNSGYSDNCDVTDGSGNPVPLHSPWTSFSSSDTEMLDLVFTVPEGGGFTVSCSVGSATVRVAPVGNVLSLLLGIAAGLVLALGALATGIVWLLKKPEGSTYPPRTS